MNKTRNIVLLVPILALLGCYEFEGERGRIGFVSNLRLNNRHAWTPDSPIAAGSFVAVFAQERLNSDSEEPPAVQGAPSGALIPMTAEREGTVEFTGEDGDAGTLRFWGEVDDHFHARFTRAAAASIAHPWEPLDGLPSRGELVVVPGETIILSTLLLSAQDELLGWPVQRLQVSGAGGVSAWTEEGMLHLIADGEGAVLLDVPGIGRWAVPVYTAEASAVESVTFSVDRDGEFILAACWLPDGSRLYGVPVRWPGEAPAADVFNTLHSPVDEACVGDRCWLVDWAPEVSR